MRPPGSVVRNSESCCTMPLCAIAQAIADAVPRISRMAPLNAAVSTSIL